MLSRRKFLTLPALFVAPAIIRIEHLMPVAVIARGNRLLTTQEISRAMLSELEAHLTLDEFGQRCLLPAAKQIIDQVDRALLVQGLIDTMSEPLGTTVRIRRPQKFLVRT